MSDADQHVDWSLTTWDGSRRAQLRHALTLTLRQRLEAAEGLADVVRRFEQVRERGGFKSATRVLDPATEALHVAREREAQYDAADARHIVVLTGCTAEPLMNYLKALGVLRLVCEQADRRARGCWVDGAFVLVSALNKEALLEFFLRRYKPTPILVPWSGSDYFDVNPNAEEKTFHKTPTGATVIEAFLANRDRRLDEYRDAIAVALMAMRKLGLRRKEQLGKPELKAAYLAELRSAGGEKLVAWIDAAAVIGPERATFSSLLGSGGGSDGNTHFSDNFMQNLWEVLPEFNHQQSEFKRAKADDTNEAQARRSLGLLRAALFGDPVDDLVEKRTSSLFDSGAVGGPNATQGMERESLTNPWAFILGIEGTLLFGGALAKRAGAVIGSTSFPFQFQFSTTHSDRSVLKEQAGREIWLPLWEKRAGFEEIRLLIGEGRAEIGRRVAVRGVDMARAAAGLGVDRGVDFFQRYAIVRGRVGGDNYNTAVSLGRFEVRFRQAATLLLEVDSWLGGFRRACNIGQKNEAPARFTSSLRRIDSAVFDYCRYGGANHFQSVLITLGHAERELMRDGSWAVKNRVQPLGGLSSEWIAAADDGSTEFELALALACVRDGEFRIDSLRANLEPVTLGRSKNGTRSARWAEKDRAVIWNTADLTTNMARALARRIMDGNREGCERLPIEFHHSASLESVAAFIARELDDCKVEDLLWGLVLIDSTSGAEAVRHERRSQPPPLPRAYALLKLLFLPRPLVADRDSTGNLRWRYARRDEPGIEIQPEPQILPLLRADRIAETCEIAGRRLRASGLTPIAGGATGVRNGWVTPASGASGMRLAAALLLPIDSRSVDRLIRLVIREDAGLKTEHFHSEGEAA